MGQLTATVSHELRNPLGAIRTAVYLISSKTKDQELGVETALARVDRSITRCDNIITELLDYTRTTDLALESLPFDDWLERVLEEQTLPATVTMRKNIATEGRQIPFDQDRMRRVIINVFDNACEAMNEIAAAGSDREQVLTVATLFANKACTTGSTATVVAAVTAHAIRRACFTLTAVTNTPG